MNSINSFLNIYLHRYVYHLLMMKNNFFLVRRKLLDQPTPRQSQVELSTATANIDNDQTDDQIIEPKITINSVNKLFVHYTHEKRFQSLKRGIMHQVYGNIFENTPVMHAKLIVSNCNHQDAKMN